MASYPQCQQADDPNDNNYVIMTIWVKRENVETIQLLNPEFAEACQFVSFIIDDTAPKWKVQALKAQIDTALAAHANNASWLQTVLSSLPQ